MRAAADAPLAALFDAHRDRPWIFQRPGGNFGDQLIYAGAEALATRLGLRWQSREPGHFEQATCSGDHCIYLHGGGGYNGWGSGRPFRMLALAARQPAALVVQGPQSVELQAGAVRDRLAESWASRQCRRLVFLARDRHSLDALRGIAPPEIEIGVDHDTALHLDDDDLLRLAGMATFPEARYDLTVSREDDERPVVRDGTPPRGLVMDPAYDATSFRHWLRIHLFARTVLSNRLHSAIACTIARKPVTIAAGSYHKNRSVWEFSLSRRGVEWSDGIRVEPRLRDRLPRRIRESYKVRKAWLLLHRVPVQ